MRGNLVHILARVTVAFIWLWHGLVPKLIYLHADELSPLTATGISPESARLMVLAAGWVEIAIGLIVLLWWRSRWPLWLTIVAMPIALIGVALTVPVLLTAAFNPMTLNVSMFVLATIALLTGRTYYKLTVSRNDEPGCITLRIAADRGIGHTKRNEGNHENNLCTPGSGVALRFMFKRPARSGHGGAFHLH